MPTHRLVDTVKILSTLGKLHKTVRFHSHTNSTYDAESTWSYSPKALWTVELEYSADTEIKAEVRGYGASFEEALHSAWEKFNKICKVGLGQEALMPPVEQTAIPAPEATNSPAS